MLTSISTPKPHPAVTAPTAIGSSTRLTAAPPIQNSDANVSSTGLGGYIPIAPRSLAETGIPESEVEALVLKVLLHRGSLAGRKIADQIAMPFQPLTEMLRRMKAENLVVYKSTSQLHDFEYELTPQGVERARRWRERCTYIGATPVSLRDYTDSVAAQSPLKTRPSLEDVRLALAELVLSPEVIDQLGQAARGGKAMFLYGSPGNGKTSIAERICRAYGPHVWIPRAINIDGEIVRVFDPIVHEEAPVAEAVAQQRQIDTRWVRIKRPTIVVGGELMLENLELTPVASTGIAEAPVQLKANCGTMVIDDFGRQRISTRELLNRWIFPLERRIDFLNTPGGKKIHVPFEQFVVFATNLSPHELVDEAFLRRIPYKIELGDPTEADFRRLFEVVAGQLGMVHNSSAVDYLLARHYRGERPRQLRSCHPRDLLEQIRNLCEFWNLPFALTPDLFDAAAKNYFAGL